MSFTVHKVLGKWNYAPNFFFPLGTMDNSNCTLVDFRWSRDDCLANLPVLACNGVASKVGREVDWFWLQGVLAKSVSTYPFWNEFGLCEFFSIVPRAFGLSHFLREKPWGRVCQSVNFSYLYQPQCISYLQVTDFFLYYAIFEIEVFCWRKIIDNALPHAGKPVRKNLLEQIIC